MSIAMRTNILRWICVPKPMRLFPAKKNLEANGNPFVTTIEFRFYNSTNPNSNVLKAWAGRSPMMAERGPWPGEDFSGRGKSHLAGKSTTCPSRPPVHQ